MPEKEQNRSQEEEINLLDYVNVVVERRRMIIRNAFVAAVLMAVISLFLPKTWTATATLLPPEERESSPLSSLMSNMPISVPGLPGLSSSSDVFVEILRSRSVSGGVVERKYDYRNQKMDLLEFWGYKSVQQAVKQLQKHTTVFANEQGIVSISVELGDPVLAAQVANALVDELDRVNQEKSFSKAKNSRMYIEEQLQQTERDLKKASEQLAKFQSEFKAVNLEEQTKVAIEKAGEIKGTIMAKEIELEVASQTMKGDNPQVQQLQKHLEGLRRQYEHLQFGNSVPFEEQKDYFIPFSDVPEVGLRFAELVREVKVQETVWQLLNQQYYSAKIQEARDTPTVQVLDEAIPPEMRTSPKRRTLVTTAFFLAGLFSVFWSFVLEYKTRLRERKGESQKLNHIVNELKSDVISAKTILSEFSRKIKKSS
jgi:uncharacterized protein involved in exopolysaccharide biosynthesis